MTQLRPLKAEGYSFRSLNKVNGSHLKDADYCNKAHLAKLQVLKRVLRSVTVVTVSRVWSRQQLNRGECSLVAGSTPTYVRSPL